MDSKQDQVRAFEDGTKEGSADWLRACVGYCLVTTTVSCAHLGITTGTWMWLPQFLGLGKDPFIKGHGGSRN